VKTALVTGSHGFIGRHIYRALIASGYEVLAWDTTARLPVDCREGWKTIEFPFDLVVHCAAMVDGREAIDGKPALIGAYNLQLDAAMFEWALRARPGRIVYLSSSAMYPVHLQRPPYAPMPLTERYGLISGEPDNTYGLVKATGEQLARAVRAAGVPVTIVRPFSGYGEDQDDCYPFPAMIARARARENPFRVWGDGTQVRDFIHVDDITAAILALVDAEVDGPVNVGTGRATSMDQLAKLCMDAARHRAPILHQADKPAGVPYRVADNRLLRQHYQPRVTLEEGISRATRRC
jgi:nucleoside-diphosphate-sugar epimerase